MTRIRYKRNETTGNFHSKPIMIGNGALVVVSLIPGRSADISSGPEFVITNFDDGAVISSGLANTWANLMIDAKKELKALGVPFQDEVRGKDMGIQPLRVAVRSDNPYLDEELENLGMVSPPETEETHKDCGDEGCFAKEELK